MDIPRRAFIDKLTPAELAIVAAVEAVESVGAHILLTEAVILLERARGKVADYVDGVGADPGADGVGGRRARAACAARG